VARVIDNERHRPWGKLWHSSDDGQTFAPVNELMDTRISRLTRSAESPDRWWAASDRGILESQDAGLTWKLVAERPDAPPAVTVVGWGDDFRTIDTTNAEGNDQIVAVAGDPLGRVPALGATLSGRVRELDPEFCGTVDRGTAPLPDDGRLNRWVVLLTSEHAGGTALMGTHHGLYVSADGGFNWRLLPCGVMGDKVGVNKLKIVESNPAIVHVCTAIGLFRIDLRNL